MKKVLSVLGLIALLSMTTPAFAAPHGGPHGGPPGRHHGGGHHVSTHRPPHMHHHRPHHGGISVHAGHPRHRYWGGYGFSYWGGYRCNYRLGYCGDYYSPYTYPCSPYVVPGASFSIRF